MPVWHAPTYGRSTRPGRACPAHQQHGGAKPGRDTGRPAPRRCSPAADGGHARGLAHQVACGTLHGVATLVLDGGAAGWLAGTQACQTQWFGAEPVPVHLRRAGGGRQEAVLGCAGATPPTAARARPAARCLARSTRAARSQQPPALALPAGSVQHLTSGVQSGEASTACSRNAYWLTARSSGSRTTVKTRWSAHHAATPSSLAGMSPAVTSSKQPAGARVATVGRARWSPPPPGVAAAKRALPAGRHWVQRRDGADAPGLSGSYWHSPNDLRTVVEPVLAWRRKIALGGQKWAESRGRRVVGGESWAEGRGHDRRAGALRPPSIPQVGGVYKPSWVEGMVECGAICFSLVLSAHERLAPKRARRAVGGGGIAQRRHPGLGTLAEAGARPVRMEEVQRNRTCLEGATAQQRRACTGHAAARHRWTPRPPETGAGRKQHRQRHQHQPWEVPPPRPGNSDTHGSPRVRQGAFMPAGTRFERRSLPAACRRRSPPPPPPQLTAASDRRCQGGCSHCVLLIELHCCSSLAKRHGTKGEREQRVAASKRTGGSGIRS